MTDLTCCRLCQCAPNQSLSLADPGFRYNCDSHDCPIAESGLTLTREQWTALMGVDRDAVRYRWLRRKVGATGPAGNDYSKWQFTFPTNITLKVSELNITDIESDFNNAIDSAMGEQR